MFRVKNNFPPKFWTFTTSLPDVTFFCPAGSMTPYFFEYGGTIIPFRKPGLYSGFCKSVPPAASDFLLPGFHLFRQDIPRFLQAVVSARSGGQDAPGSAGILFKPGIPSGYFRRHSAILPAPDIRPQNGTNGIFRITAKFCFWTAGNIFFCHGKIQLGKKPGLPDGQPRNTGIL